MRDSVRGFLPSDRVTSTRGIVWECLREPFCEPGGGSGGVGVSCRNLFGNIFRRGLCGEGATDTQKACSYRLVFSSAGCKSSYIYCSVPDIL